MWTSERDSLLERNSLAPHSVETGDSQPLGGSFLMTERGATPTVPAHHEGPRDPFKFLHWGF